MLQWPNGLKFFQNQMKIISYNVNGIRSAINKGFYEWLATENPDVICLQELKALQSDVPVLELEALGYHHTWFSAEKKGYSGVATFSKQQPDAMVQGVGVDAWDKEGRILRTDFGDWTLLNCYFPSGTSGDERQGFKMQFLHWFQEYVDGLKKERPRLIIVGDYNIAHNEIDIHDPKGNKNSTGFLPEERAWMTQWFNSGFTDAFRYKNPELVEYSWWTFRAGARANNKGWRIDYQSVSDNLREHITAARQLTTVVHSDHCPVMMEIAL
jgi:exodeoxyribonuclease III